MLIAHYKPPSWLNAMDAKVSARKKPTISVMVVRIGPEARAGSIFSPLSIRLHNSHQDSISVTKNGQVMRVPTLNGNSIYELSYNKRGTKLFGHQDKNLAQFIFTIARESIRLKQAREQSKTAERNRIMRDLHDNVSGKLLHLIHSADSEHQAHIKALSREGA